jgi:hypothetical protein
MPPPVNGVSKAAPRQNRFGERTMTIPWNAIATLSVRGKERHFGSVASCVKEWIDLSAEERALARIDSNMVVTVPTPKKALNADDIQWVTEQLEPDGAPPLSSAP